MCSKLLHLNLRLQGLVRHRDQALADKTATLNKITAELSTTKGALQEERAKLQRREEVSWRGRCGIALCCRHCQGGQVSSCGLHPALWLRAIHVAGVVLQELLKARAEVEGAHEALKAEHKDVQARHSQASSEASSCTLQLADCRSR